MLRTTVVGSWPVDAQFEEAMRAFHAGTLPVVEAKPLLTQVASVAIAQQRACNLDEITGGETSADTFILQFPRYLTGITPTENAQAWGGRGTYTLTGELAAPQGLGIAAAYARERAIDPGIHKVTIPGPSEITMMIETQGERTPLWEQAIGLMRAEIRACVDLGAREIQLDLPHVAMGLVDDDPQWDAGRAVEIIHTTFAGFQDIRRSVHFCYGDFEAQTWTKNRAFQPLLATLQRLDGVIDRAVLEFSLPEQWADRALLAQIPTSMEIAAGIVDVKSPHVETPDQLAAKIRELEHYVPSDRLSICPSCGFGRRNTALAMAKAQAMTEAVAQVNLG